MATTITLLTLGETQSALGAAQQAQEIFQALLAQQPDSTDLSARIVGFLLTEVGDVQVAQGNLPAALTSYQASLAIIERLAKSDPGNAELAARPGGFVQQGWRRAGGAGRSAGRADLLSGEPRHHERLAKSDPGNAGWQRDLAVSYDRSATCRRRRAICRLR